MQNHTYISALYITHTYVLSILPHQCSRSEVDSRQNYSRVHTNNVTESVSASQWITIFVTLKCSDLLHVNDYSIPNN